MQRLEDELVADRLAADAICEAVDPTATPGTACSRLFAGGTVSTEDEASQKNGTARKR